MSPTAAPEIVTKTLPVVEVFGPVLQGEGVLAGLPTHFVRFGGCDFRCLWCDSMYAVEPEQVRENAEKLTADEILARLDELQLGPSWVTLSGGNPAMLDLTRLVGILHLAGYQVAVETQGSMWKPWLEDVDCLTVSPKPPSSGMTTDNHQAQYDSFMQAATRAMRYVDGALKIAVFDDQDFEWALERFREQPKWSGFLSVGTDPIAEWGKDWIKTVNTRQVRDDVGERYRWLCEKVAGHPELANVRVLPQLHVVAFGHARGV